MNLLVVLGFIGIGQGLYLILISWRLAFTLKTKLSLSLLMGSHILLLLSVIFYEMDWHTIFPHFLFIRVPIPLLIGPSLYILYKSIFFKDKPYDHKMLLHFTPFLIYLVMMAPYYIQGASIKLSGVTPDDYIWVNYFMIEHFKIIHLSTYLIWIFYINRSQVLTFDYLNFLRPYRKLFLWILIFYSIIIFLSITNAILLSTGINLPYNTDFIIAFITTLLAYWISFVFTRYDKEWKKVFKKIVGKKSKIGEQVIVKLKELMEERAMYRDCDLKIGDISTQLSVPRQFLSEIINNELGVNFSEFVNGYRIREFKSKVLDPNENNKTLLGIAYESGFNSKTSFQRIFKASTGMTPSEYKKFQIK